MIRKYSEKDIESVLHVWLKTSIKAYNFIPPEFWESELESMRNIYIPASELFVYEQDSNVVGFYALKDNELAAIFLLPECQGHGVGKQLLSHAKEQREELRLTVYKENRASYDFYLSQGFKVINEEVGQKTGHLQYVMISGS
ncbi:GNAT family N-acetyltransferase [Vibrio parahaemolyticus]|uniref:GNAT family N-acetyltransferase n=1 Tax=Vibrio parahaemolyticus TaxID=670 RepID=UPI0011217AC1|nr:GNAT family N-acetyltransferase [Vibrio parahaemolyticus]EGS6501011.1 GNAT family N-acetyltransferase [Vibrio parahaemolyticus]ELF4880018.1 GNAT family N-acetyltransferase [Vibrio parahaemolyticus]MDF4592992.1 GNAT family N-acetyltransferase [Vibrio parahaemolyticus]TOE03052.1 GNAT family N-acetyltransferase [Vibrio parahaemolyticus]TOH99522.1 GNAT family N-acetyltransferase [Vibrio parahaemolyticus]